MILIVISLLCASLIGFTAHRASLCNVRAVGEVMSDGSAHMLWSLLQAVLWMATLGGVLTLVFGMPPLPATVRTPAAWAPAGGWLFGLGAAVNGGCSLSTLHRLADGELGMAATLGGFASGIWLWPAILWTGPTAGLAPVATPWLRWPEVAPGALIVLLVWAAWQLRQFHRLARPSRGHAWAARLLAPTYPLAVAAALLGLAGGWLYALQGQWSYTGFLRDSLLHRWDASTAPPPSHALLVTALVGGMAASAWQRGSLRWRSPSRARDWLRHAGGGALMGLGAAMVPGGNDTLLLGGLPAFTGTAALAYLSLLLGIASGLVLLRLIHVPMPAFACDAGGCSESRPTAAAPVPPSSSRRDA